MTLNRRLLDALRVHPLSALIVVASAAWQIGYLIGSSG